MSEVETNITLYSFTGQIVLQTPFVSTGGASQTISVAHLPAAVYFYTVCVAGGDTGNGNMGGAVLARGKVAVVR
ncbi:hypothetical protein B6N25_10525 [Sphingobacteriales bacterium TSM_CSS]|nr:hypothetical protein B6N25_10525 [Sphingobacteriales bacterium TSM_CSS]